MSFKCRKRKSSSRLWSLNGPRLATQVRVLFFKTVHVHQHTDIWDIYTRMRVINSDCEYLWEFSERILTLKMTPFLFFLSYSFVEALFRTTKKIHIFRPLKIIEKWFIKFDFHWCWASKNCLTTLSYLHRHFLYLKSIDVEYLDAKSDGLIPIIEKHKPTRYILTR